MSQKESLMTKNPSSPLDWYDKLVLDKILKRRKITESGCWEFTGKTTKGYGTIHYEGANVGVHRVVYKILCPDKFKTDLLCCHTCDNRLCFNPEHLYMGTLGDNISDAYGRGQRIAFKAKNTHCPHGHEFNEENTRWHHNARSCRTCDRERMRERRARVYEKCPR